MLSFSIGEEADVLPGTDFSPGTSAALPYAFWRTHFFWRKKVLRFTVVDNSDFSLNRLTVSMDSPYPSL
jgi:hypothetical protein